MTNEEVGALSAAYATRLKHAIEGTLEMTGQCLMKVLLAHVGKGWSLEAAEEFYDEVAAEINSVIAEANRINSQPQQLP